MRSNQNPGTGSKGEPETKSMGTKALAVNGELTLLPLKFNWESTNTGICRPDGCEGDRQTDRRETGRSHGRQLWGWGQKQRTGDHVPPCPCVPREEPNEHSVRGTTSICGTLGAGPCRGRGQAPVISLHLDRF